MKVMNELYGTYFILDESVGVINGIFYDARANFDEPLPSCVNVHLVEKKKEMRQSAIWR